MGYFPNSEWRAVPPEQAGISQDNLNYLLARIETEKMGIHGLILLYQGYLIFEKYWDMRYRDTPEHVVSITKSVISLLAGIAIAEKLIDEEAPVLSYFPKILPSDILSGYEGLKIKHLLSMTSGQDKDSVWDKANAIPAFFKVPLSHAPGSRFAYLNGCATMVAAIIQQETGRDLADYADKKLFAPLGIPKPRWNINPDGIYYGGYGIWLKTRDIARLGLLLINQGRWNDSQVVPEAYLLRATGTELPDAAEKHPGLAARYGYFFWKNTATLGGYHAFGLNGHYCIVLPESDLVCVTTAEGNMSQFLRAFEEMINMAKVKRSNTAICRRPMAAPTPAK